LFLKIERGEGVERLH